MPLESRTVPIRISIPADASQPRTVEVDGLNVAGQIEGFRYDAAGHGPAVLTLYGPAAGEISGDAIVRVMVDSDPRQVLADALSRVDPGQLEKAALNRLDFDDEIDHGLTAAMLRELAEMVSRG